MEKGSSVLPLKGEETESANGRADSRPLTPGEDLWEGKEATKSRRKRENQQGRLKKKKKEERDSERTQRGKV